MTCLENEIFSVLVVLVGDLLEVGVEENRTQIPSLSLACTLLSSS